MSLLIVGKIDVPETQYEWIEAVRKQYDKVHYSIIYPHFTLVFPIDGISKEQFIDDVTKQAAGVKPIKFNIRCASLNRDAFNDSYNVFLVPDEGYSDIVKLHDRLYAKSLANSLRLDIQFVPHITIANSNDSKLCKRLADEINQENIHISGQISRLDVLEYENGVIKSLKELKLI